MSKPRSTTASKGTIVVTKTKGIVIIGNGIAGNSAASAIRQFDHAARITMISDERQPLYSPCAFHKYFSGELQRPKLFLKQFNDYTREGIRTVFGRKVSEVDIGNRIVWIGDERVPFDKLILATGSKLLPPPIKGIQKSGAFVVKTMDDALAISQYPARTVAVLGSGPIGIETAVAFRKKGLKVLLIEMFDRVLPRLFDRTAAILIQEILENHGIRVLTQEKVAEIVGEETVQGLVTDKQALDCQMVIMATGALPNTELAIRAGVATGAQGGVKIDEYMVTSVEDIYSCGDCIESRDAVTGQSALSMLWHNAKRQGQVAGLNAAGKRSRYAGAINATSMELFGTHVASLGIGASSAYPDDQETYEIIDTTRGSGLCRIILKDNRMVGIQLINNLQHGGVLLSRMVKKETVFAMPKCGTSGASLSMRPWNYWMKIYGLADSQPVSGRQQMDAASTSRTGW